MVTAGDAVYFSRADDVCFNTDGSRRKDDKERRLHVHGRKQVFFFKVESQDLQSENRRSQKETDYGNRNC